MMEPMPESQGETLQSWSDLQALAADWLAVGEQMPMPHLSPLLLTTDEVEVLLCFALLAPLPFGPLEEALCEKLQGHLHCHARLRTAPAPAD